MSCRVPSNLLSSLHMKRSKAHHSSCTHDFSAAFVQEHQRAVLDFHHGKYLSFRKGHSSLVFRATAVDPKPFRAYEIRGEPIGITGIVVVRVAVGVHIAEVVGVVVIRRPLPPIRSRTHGRKNPNRQVLQRYTHRNQNLPPLITLQNAGQQAVLSINQFTEVLCHTFQLFLCVR